MPSELRILSYNVHLFGKTAAIVVNKILQKDRTLYFQDERRAAEIGKRLLDREGNAAYDIVCLQEVWDPGLLDIIEEQVGDAYASKVISGFGLNDYLYAIQKQGTPISEVDWSNQAPTDPLDWKKTFKPLGGGVVILLREGLKDKQESWGSYGVFADDDAYADKGVRSRSKADPPGPVFAVFNTHMQSNSKYWGNVQQPQIEQARERIQKYKGKNHHPGSLAIFTGDLNIQAEYTEKNEREDSREKAKQPTTHYNWMMQRFAAEGTSLRDAYRVVHPPAKDSADNFEAGFTVDSGKHLLARKFAREPDDDAKRTDYIFVANSEAANATAEVTECTAERWTYQSDTDGELDLSDHFPLTAKIELAGS